LDIGIAYGPGGHTLFFSRRSLNKKKVMANYDLPIIAHTGQKL
jgi:hypothetical protein